MTDEPTDTEPEPDWGEPDEDITEEVIRGVLAIWDRKDTTPTRDDLYRTDYFLQLTPEELYLAPVVWFGAAYVENLARHASEATIEVVKGIWARRKRRTGESWVGVDGPPAATVVITDDLPDEARLALLDLDVMGPELRWNKAAGTWLAVEPLTAGSDEAASASLATAGA